MRKDLIPKQGQFYKANLHCHSTVSDGHWTPEQIRSEYMKHGYSIVAYTDHDVLIPHPDLKQDGFLPLNGFEIEINQPGTGKTCHICMIALEEENTIQPFWHRSKYLFGNAGKYRDKVRFDPALPDYEREYDPEKISDIMETCREKGFFVTYNHPTWSMENYPEYVNYHGMHAMEMVNYGCWICGNEEYNSRVYDDLLRTGHRIYCVDTDDNHNELEDAFGGFTMIKAGELSYRAITSALEAGHFYASQGPEIYELWIDGRTVHLTCSPAARINMYTQGRYAALALADKESDLTEAEFHIPENCEYFRLSVTDAAGNKADTNAYFLDELG